MGCTKSKAYQSKADNNAYDCPRAVATSALPESSDDGGKSLSALTTEEGDAEQVESAITQSARRPKRHNQASTTSSNVGRVEGGNSKPLPSSSTKRCGIRTGTSHGRRKSKSQHSHATVGSTSTVSANVDPAIPHALQETDAAESMVGVILLRLQSTPSRTQMPKSSTAAPVGYSFLAANQKPMQGLTLIDANRLARRLFFDGHGCSPIVRASPNGGFEIRKIIKANVSGDMSNDPTVKNSSDAPQTVVLSRAYLEELTKIDHVDFGNAVLPLFNCRNVREASGVKSIAATTLAASQPTSRLPNNNNANDTPLPVYEPSSSPSPPARKQTSQLDSNVLHPSVTIEQHNSIVAIVNGETDHMSFDAPCDGLRQKFAMNSH